VLILATVFHETGRHEDLFAQGDFLKLKKPPKEDYQCREDFLKRRVILTRPVCLAGVHVSSPNFKVEFGHN
jgi:hypothetical protein